MAAVQPILVAPPDPFSFISTEWEDWLCRFQRYRDISGLVDKSEKVQVSTLIYTMGPQAESVFKTLKLSQADANIFDKVTAAYSSFFVPRVNLVFERAKFNMRKQEQGEPVDAFIADLHALAERCKFDSLKEDLIRDRIVVGIADPKLSEKLQMDDGLTLTTAIHKVQQAELVRSQQDVVRSSDSSSGVDKMQSQVSMVKSSSTKNSKSVKQSHSPRQSNKPKSAPFTGKQCGYCGFTVHTGDKCPATNVLCKLCGKKGHFARVCRSSGGSGAKNKTVGAIEQPLQAQSDSVSYFIGSVGGVSEPWKVKVQVGKFIKSKVMFTLDSGADITCMSSDQYNPKWGCLESVNSSIKGPSGANLDVMGRVNTSFSYNSIKCKGFIYFIKNLSRPLLGRPELKNLNVFRVAGVQCDEKPADRKKWLKVFPKLFHGLGKLHCNYKISLKECIEPFSCSVARRVSLPQLPKVEKALQSMVNQDIISSVTEPTDWCAPMVVVPKPSGDLRITTDFTELNRSVWQEKFKMPSVDFTLGKLGGAKYFSKLDANSGFFQIVLDKRSRKLTTFITPFGRYCYHRLPMGISSAPEVFSRAIQQILQGLDGVSNLVDDICVYAPTKELHDQRLEVVLSKLQKAGVTLNPDKCVFGASTLKYLGFLITKSGILPDPDKVSAISKYPAPTNIHEVRRFLGMVNNLARFVPNLSSVLEPIRSLLRKDASYSWDATQQEAFDKVKSILVSPDVLVLYNPKLETCVRADSSSFGLGAVLLQRVNNQWKPVSYISRSLTPTESRYTTIEKEALVITLSCERLSQYLLGTHFLIQTDHNPLVSLLAKKRLDELPVRVQRFRLRLLRFSYSIEYISGSQQTVADALSRAPLTDSVSLNDMSLCEVIDDYASGMISSLPASKGMLQEIKLKQDQDSVLKTIKEYCCSEWPDRIEDKFLQYYSVRDDLAVIDGLLVKGFRLVIPPCLRNHVLEKLHLGHQGITKCYRRARDSVWWPNITVHIKHMVARCNICLQYRNNAAEPMNSIGLPERPWQIVGTDLFHFSGRQYLLVVDYFSRYIEIALLGSSTALCVITHLKSMFARHGIPDELISDGGPPYKSRAFDLFSSQYGFEHTYSSPYYSQGNGESERAVQTIKNIMKKVSGQDLYLALLSYRTTPLENGFSPAQLLMGRDLRTPLPILPSQLKPSWPNLELLREKENKSRERIKGNYDCRKGVKSLDPLHPGQQVYVKKKGLAKVESYSGNRSYQFKSPDDVYFRRNRRFAIVVPPRDKLETPQSPSAEKPVIPQAESLPISPNAPRELPRRSQRSTRGKLPIRYRD